MRTHKTELVIGVSLYLILTIFVSAIISPMVSTTEIVPVQTADIDWAEPMPLMTAEVKEVQFLDTISCVKILEVGDSIDGGVVVIADAREVITMTVRADGVKFFENHLIG
jgi:hypothetical protein